MITAAVLLKIAPVCKNPEGWALPLDRASVSYGIDTPAEVAEWLAQLAHESAGFNRLIENLNYSAKGLMGTWPKRFPTLAVAEQYARQPEKIANFVYSGRMGNDQPGDGWKYRGRGLIQLTGKTNYTRAGAGTGLPLVSHPEWAAQQNPAAILAAWFWRDRNLDYRTDDIENDTRIINGGLTGLKDRRGYWKRAKETLNV